MPTAGGIVGVSVGVAAGGVAAGAVAAGWVVVAVGASRSVVRATNAPTVPPATIRTIAAIAASGIFQFGVGRIRVRAGAPQVRHQA